MGKIIILVLIVVGGLFAWRWYNPTENAMPANYTKEPADTETTEEELLRQTPPTSAPTAPSTQPTTGATIELTNFAFSPKTLTIKAGTSVTFINRDLAGHSVTADNGSFDSGIISQGKSTIVPFNTKGTFGFHCNPHPNMKVTIVVE